MLSPRGIFYNFFSFNDGRPPLLPELYGEEQEYERRVMWSQFATFVLVPMDELELITLSNRFESILGEVKDLQRENKKCAAMA